MTSATPVTVVGGTGLTGAESLTALLASSHAFAVTALTRRSVEKSSSNPSSSFSNKTFPDLLEAVKAPVGTSGGVYVSCLGTTLQIAGSVAKQRQIDVDLNRDLAKKAREDGATTVGLESLAS